MSFSGEVKEELVRLESDARHCQIAELSALLIYSGAVTADESGRNVIALQSDTPCIVERCSMLLKKIFNTSDIGNGGIAAEKILQTIKYTQGDILVNPLVIKSLCCKRAYLRGAFLSIGSMSNPEKGYHLELVCGLLTQALQIRELLLGNLYRCRRIVREKASETQRHPTRGTSAQNQIRSK